MRSVPNFFVNMVFSLLFLTGSTAELVITSVTRLGDEVSLSWSNAYPCADLWQNDTVMSSVWSTHQSRVQGGTVVFVETNTASYFALASRPVPDTATYMIEFNATWSAVLHPQDYPTNAHFSPMVGAVHASNQQFWAAGTLASSAIETMAERGNPNPLRNLFIASGVATEFVGQTFNSPGMDDAVVMVPRTNAFITLVSMIAPSPDWFVGVHNLSLMDECGWRDDVVINLFPYDAGTDSGSTYLAVNQETVPQTPIFPITGYPFLNGTNFSPLGTFRFLRLL